MYLGAIFVSYHSIFCGPGIRAQDNPILEHSLEVVVM